RVRWPDSSSRGDRGRITTLSPSAARVIAISWKCNFVLRGDVKINRRTNMKKQRSRLVMEQLETRYVPAVTIVNALTATYTDVDGDHVTVKVTAGTLTAGNFTTAASGAGDQ